MRVATGSLASDVRSLDALKEGAAKDPKGAVRAAASQFEALFMQMVLKSMRDAVPRSGMLDGPGADVYRSMLDSQFAQSMAGKPGGLGELIARQLARSMRLEDGAPGGAAPDVSDAALRRALLAAAAVTDAAADREGDAATGSPLPDAAQASAAAAVRARADAVRVPSAAIAARAPLGADPLPAARGDVRPDTTARPAGTAASFVDDLWDAARHAERTTGVPAGFIVGQAALETGWGRQQIRHPDGRSANNLFGIKAGPGWRGDTVDATTTEYVDGRAVKTVERFRAYASHQDAFADWARLMSGNPRYAAVLRAGEDVDGFARQLQQAGYATDPDYATKLTRTINQALALRRAGA